MSQLEASSSTPPPNTGNPPLTAHTPSIRRAVSPDESAQLRRTLRSRRSAPTMSDAPPPPPTSGARIRRRSSTFSDLTDDILLPKPRKREGSEGGGEGESSHWDSAPLAFALFPAIGGMVFQNGSSVVTDVMLLGLAAVFLNWSVRVPWTWYHSAQAIRIKDEYNSDAIIEESDDENGVSITHTTLDDVPEEVAQDLPAATKGVPLTIKPRLPAHEAAATELYRHEVLALISCFMFPLFGAYMLHAIRSQLTRPSEGLVSNYNLTIFMLASEVRPLAHLVKLIQARTLHLQRVVNSNPYDNPQDAAVRETKDLLRRLVVLEARSSGPDSASAAASEPTMNGKQSSVALTIEVRKTLQPDLDALNRAVRRYEKRATLQAFQTESRLQDLESRLNDAIALAAAAAKNDRQRGFTAIILEWFATAIVIPLQAFGMLASLPFKSMIAVINFVKTRILGAQAEKKKMGNGKQNGSYVRHVERAQRGVPKR